MSMRSLGKFIWPGSKWGRAAVGMVGLVVVLVGVGWYLTRPGQLTPMVESVLADLTHTQAELDQAHLTWGGQLVLEGVHLRVPSNEKRPSEKGEKQGTSARLFDAGRITIEPDWSDLLRAHLQPNQITVVHPVVHVIENLDTGRYNYQNLQIESPGPEAKLTALPRIVVEGGQVRFYHRQASKLEQIGQNPFHGQLAPPPQTPDIYRLILTSGRGGEQGAIRLIGRIDLPKQQAQLRLDGFHFDQPQGTLLPHDLRQWWDRLDPTGTLPEVTVKVGPNQQGRMDLLSAKVAVHDLALTVPYQLMGLIDRSRQVASSADNSPHSREGGNPQVPGSTSVNPSEPRLRADEASPPTGSSENPDAKTKPNAPPRTRMTQVTGQFKYREGRIIVPRMSGVIEGVRYHVQGRHGLSADEPFEIKVKTEPFYLPANPDYYPALPEVAHKLHRMFRPSGRFRMRWTISRPSKRAAISVAGTINIIEARATYEKFPYPCRTISRGRIRFTDDWVKVNNLVALGPTGTRMVLNGKVAPLGDEARVRFTANVTDLPIDRHLLGAMEPKYRRVVNLFFDQAGYEELLGRGLVRRPNPGLSRMMPDLDSVQRPPAFEPGGTLDQARIVIHRPPGPDKDYKVTVAFDAGGLNIVFAPWPYPARTTGGTIKIGPKRIEVKRLDLRGLTGAVARISGNIERGGRLGPNPHLRIEQARIPLDRALLASLPSPQDQWVDGLNLDGKIRAHGQVFRPSNNPAPTSPTPDSATSPAASAPPSTQPSPTNPHASPQPPINFNIHATIERGSIASLHNRYRVNNLAGQFTLTRDHLTVHRVRGTRGKSEFKVRGLLGWQGGQPRVNLHLKARHLKVEQALTDLIPPGISLGQRLASLFQTYRPRGLVDVRGRLTHRDNTANGEAIGQVNPREKSRAEPNSGEQTRQGPNLVEPDLDFELTARPQRLSVVHDGRRLQFTDMTGLARLSPQHLEITDLAGRFGKTSQQDQDQSNDKDKKSDAPAKKGGRFNISGLLGLGPSPSHALSIQAQAPTIGPTVRNILPDPVADAMDRLNLAGPWQLKKSRLRYQPEAKNRPTFEFAGQVGFDQASAFIGLPVTQIDGDLGVKALLAPGQSHPQFDLSLRADQLRIKDRLVSPLFVDIATHDQRHILEIDSIRGSIYRGSLVGHGMVQLASPGRYQFDLTMQDALLEPIASQTIARQRQTLRSLIGLSSDDQGLPLLPKPVSLPRDAGLISAGLHVESIMGKPDQRRGRGTVLVKNARLIHRPLSMAMLQAINLSVPQSSSFDAVAARFLIHGQSLWFDTLSFESPSVHITGSGRMQLPSTRLDLTMFNRNPNNWMWAPIHDLYNSFKDQVMAVKITGTLLDPEASVVPFENIRRTWSALFSQRHAKRGSQTNPIIPSR